jgi:hypothetical protein
MEICNALNCINRPTKAAISWCAAGGRFSFSQALPYDDVARTVHLRKPRDRSKASDGGFLEDEQRLGHRWLVT